MKTNRIAVVSAMASAMVVFLLSTAPALAQPEVSYTIPLANTVDNAANTQISIIFTEPMLVASFDNVSVSIYGSLTGNTFAAMEYDSFTKTAKFNPLWDFLPGEKITVIVNTDILSQSSVPLAKSHVFEFIIGVTPSSALFDSVRKFQTGDMPVACELADYDSDGILDLVTINRNSNNYSSYVGWGGGMYDFPSFGLTGMWPLGICVADVNRILDPGFLVANFTEDSISVMEHSGGVTFHQQKYKVSGGSSFITTGDLNGDGFLDIISTDFDSMSVLMHTGTFAYDPYVTYAITGTFAADVKVADINNDGDQDVILSVNGGGPGNLSIYRNDGFGTLSGSPDIYPLSGAPIGIAVGDLNGDAWVDLVVICRADSTMKILMNNGIDGNLLPAVVYHISQTPLWVVAADFDGDLHLDLVIANENGTNLALFMNNGPGTFAAEQSIAIGNTTGWVSFGDVDGDGDLDLAVPLPDEDSVAILFNANLMILECGQYAKGFTGNINCDDEGKRNLADITRLIDRVYISKDELCVEGEGNTNGDDAGKINLADITILIDHVYISKAETAACE